MPCKSVSHKSKKVEIHKRKVIEKMDMDINGFPNKPWFLHVCCTSLLKTVGKGEIARNEEILLFP